MAVLGKVSSSRILMTSSSLTSQLKLPSQAIIRQLMRHNMDCGGKLVPQLVYKTNSQRGIYEGISPTYPDLGSSPTDSEALKQSQHPRRKHMHFWLQRLPNLHPIGSQQYAMQVAGRYLLAGPLTVIEIALASAIIVTVTADIFHANRTALLS